MLSASGEVVTVFAVIVEALAHLESNAVAPIEAGTEDTQLCGAFFLRASRYDEAIAPIMPADRDLRPFPSVFT